MMLSMTDRRKAPRLKTSGATSNFSRRFGACLQTSFLALGCVAGAGAASASTAFDGNWSVVITSQNGACVPSVRYGLQIANGRVIPGSGEATVSGAVTPSGVVKVIVQSGSSWASGSGRLRGTTGGGVWNGQGALGACDGTWVAERRGPGVQAQAQAQGGPVYNYAPGGLGPRAPAIGGRAASYCAARFHSYDPTTGTYLAADGFRHRCP
jgi:BA14K-like protein